MRGLIERWPVLVAAAGIACGDYVAQAGAERGSGAATTSSGDEWEGGSNDGDGDGDGDGDPTFDLEPGADATGPDLDPDLCKVGADAERIEPCPASIAGAAFEPRIQWTFTDPHERGSYVTPLVANLTDDDHDGVIDLCDTPDVVLVAAVDPGPPGAVGHIFVIAGDTGELHFRIPTDVDANFTPALGDIDNDGLVEIVTLRPDGWLIAFAHDGELEWTKPATWGLGGHGSKLSYGGSVALADLDNDGDVEIVSANQIFDHEGERIHELPTIAGQWGATVLADLDGDDDLEVVLGSAAYHHDGSLAWDTGLPPGYPQVADLDDDGLPEVLLTNGSGLSQIEHDGLVTYAGLRPIGVDISGTHWHRSATIHDFDGDGQPEFALGSGPEFTVYEPDASVVWTASVADESGIAGASAFDLFGTGIAQPVYADEQQLWVFDELGEALLTLARTSGTLTEYPVVADIDDDGSAEILVVSNLYNHPGSEYACLRAIGDANDRWVPARRIWNQHSYHVSNVREDGSIPQFEPKSWAGLNTFRAQAQIIDGALCDPG